MFTAFIFLGYNIFGVTVSATTMLAPYRLSLVWQIIVCIVCTLWFIVSIESFIFVGRNMAGQPWSISKISVVYFSEITGTVFVGLIVSYLTKSKFIAAMWGLAVVIGILRYVLILDFGSTYTDAWTLVVFFDYYDYTVLSLLFDVLTMGSLLCWALYERRRFIPDHSCPMCEYNLAGIHAEGCCPECGHKIE